MKTILAMPPTWQSSCLPFIPWLSTTSQLKNKWNYTQTNHCHFRGLSLSLYSPHQWTADYDRYIVSSLWWFFSIDCAIGTYWDHNQYAVQCTIFPSDFRNSNGKHWPQGHVQAFYLITWYNLIFVQNNTRLPHFINWHISTRSLPLVCCNLPRCVVQQQKIEKSAFKCT